MNIPIPVLKEFLDEPLVAERVRLEAFLTVALGARNCALLIVPADLPGGEKLAIETEESCRDAYLSAVRETDPQRKMELVRIFTEARREAFARIALDSPEYLALTRWARMLGLRAVANERLPTTWEVYLLKGWRTHWRLNRLMETRASLLRGEKKSPPDRANLVLFPEEFSPEYTRRLGELLGYPRCCIERFIQDRAGATSVEERAADQIKRLKREGKDPEPYSYPLTDFFPCYPTCPEAKKWGESMHRTLAQVLPEAGEHYRKLLYTNSLLVEQYPEVIRMHREKLQSLRL